MTFKAAYIVSRFPHLPETFIMREMNELAAQGCSVELFPLVLQEQALVHRMLHIGWKSCMKSVLILGRVSVPI